MDRHDPNQWTRDFVAENKDFCVGVIKDTNNQVISLLKSGEHKAAIAGLDRILNGLVTMINSGFDYRSQACFFSWVEANIMLFGELQDAPEQNRINTAKEALLDARDFAKSETTKNNIGAIIDDINKGYSLSELEDKYCTDFPAFETETLSDLNDKLENRPSSTPARTQTSSDSSHSGSSRSDSSHSNASRSGSSNSGSPKGGKAPWLIIVIIALVIGVILGVFLLNNQGTEKSPDFAEKAPALAETLFSGLTSPQSPVYDDTDESDTEGAIAIAPNGNKDMMEKLAGTWKYAEITRGAPNPDGGTTPEERSEAYYTFSSDGKCSFGDAQYLEADKSDEEYAEYIDGMYWICVGGGGQSGSYTISENEIIITTDDSVQYGPSTTSSITFTLEGDTLTLVHNFGTTVYNRVDSTSDKY